MLFEALIIPLPFGPSILEVTIVLSNERNIINIFDDKVINTDFMNFIKYFSFVFIVIIPYLIYFFNN